jgi:glutamate synthase domain-containing protein 3
MKELIVALISFTLGYFTAATDAYAQTQYFYGPNGQYQGQAMRSGNTQYFYGANGQYQGQALQSGNITSLYGANGQYQGQTMGNTVIAPPVLIVPPTQSLTPMFDSVFGR